VDNAIEANALGKRYRRRWALADCTLTVPAGQVVGLVGPNGAGKTTLLELAVGLLRPTTGTIAVRQRAGRLSGGQRAQLALTLAVARRPELLVLDEPAANLDPLARRDFLDSVTRAVADSGEGMTTVFSSHLVADLERTCGYLILLAGGQVRLTGQVDALLERNHARSLDDLVVTYLREVPR